jgi:hypothetical protein
MEGRGHEDRDLGATFPRGKLNSYQSQWIKNRKLKKKKKKKKE